jgi:hypothetical protein
LWALDAEFRNESLRIAKVGFFGGALAHFAEASGGLG